MTVAGSTQIQYIDKSVLSRVETAKSQIVQKSPKVSLEFERYPIVLQKTTRSELLLSLKAYSEGNLSQQHADAEKGQNITNATGHQEDHPVQAR